MADSKTAYWRFFNALGRFVGACFALVGGIFVIYGAVQKDGLFAFVGLIFAVLGILLMLARPYRPDSDSTKR